MLYYLSLLEGDYSPLRVFQYITVRTVGAGRDGVFSMHPRGTMDDQTPA